MPLSVYCYDVFFCFLFAFSFFLYVVSFVCVFCSVFVCIVFVTGCCLVSFVMCLFVSSSFVLDIRWLQCYYVVVALLIY